MSDYSELKRLADAAQHDRHLGALDDYADAATPAVVLALIAENERLAGECEGCPMVIAEDLRKERDQLKAENNRISRNRDMWKHQVDAQAEELQVLRKRIDDMSPLKGAPLTGPDLKCLACGGYHYGMGGLPCPKMTPMAVDGKDG